MWISKIDYQNMQDIIKRYEEEAKLKYKADNYCIGCKHLTRYSERNMFGVVAERYACKLNNKCVDFENAE